MSKKEKAAKKGRTRANGEGGLLEVRGSRFYYAQYYQDGRQIRVSTRTDNKQEALAVLRKLMGDRDNGMTPVTDVKKLKYADLRQALIDSYVAQGNKSLKSKADGSESIAGLTALDDFFGFKSEMTDGKQVVTERGMSVAQITTDAARRFVHKRRAEGTGNAAINRSLAALRRMLRIAKRDKKIHDVPYIEFQKEPPARKGFLERKDFERLIKVLPTHLRPLVTFLYWCGCRIGETLQIEWSQVDLDARQIRLEPEQTKGDEGRIVPLSSELVNMLRDIEPKEGTVFDGTNLRKEWMEACAACELGTVTEVEGRPYDPLYSGLTLHDMRRSAVRNMRKAGISEKEAMRISGHKTRAVFERYNIVSTEDVMDAMRKLELAAMNETALLKASSNTRKPVRGERLVKVSRRTTRKSLMALSSRG
jgi:integrase